MTAPDSNTGQKSNSSAVTTTVYNDDGDIVTATIDPLGRVAGVGDPRRVGNVTAGYQGQIIANSDPTPRIRRRPRPLLLDLQQPHARQRDPKTACTTRSMSIDRGEPGLSRATTVTDARATIQATTPRPATRRDTPLGDDWYDLEHGDGPVGLDGLGRAVEHNGTARSGRAPSASCSRPPTTAYDDAGNVTATIDALDRVTATTTTPWAGRRRLPGQVLESVSTDPNYDNSSPSWAFTTSRRPTAGVYAVEV